MLVIIILILVIVFLCVAINAVKSSSKTNKLTQQQIVEEQRKTQERAQARERESSRGFDEEWDLLSRYDPDVRPQVERLEGYGPGAVEELKRVFAFNKDKKSLIAVADKIVEDIESGKAAFDPAGSEVHEGTLERTEKADSTSGATQEWKCSKCHGPVGTNYGSAEILICNRCADV